MKKILARILLFSLSFNTGSPLFAARTAEHIESSPASKPAALKNWTHKKIKHGVLMVRRALGYAPCSPAERAEAQKWVGKVSAAVIGALIIAGGLTTIGIYAAKRKSAKKTNGRGSAAMASQAKSAPTFDQNVFNEFRDRYLLWPAIGLPLETAGEGVEERNRRYFAYELKNPIPEGASSLSFPGVTINTESLSGFREIPNLSASKSRFPLLRELSGKSYILINKKPFYLNETTDYFNPTTYVVEVITSTGGYDPHFITASPEHMVD